MTGYEKTVTLWQQKNITTDAEPAETLNYTSPLQNITYHDIREIFEHDGVTSHIGGRLSSVFVNFQL